ncbi:hypothetical protein BDV93DRAFT_524307 [Ceratobasidium sp. AG-I]|nr:hypothetical protein BDV93DRAFT_524307 [Ceratobasidium sp. AG-I]
MTQTISKQGSNYLILQAIYYVLPLLPGFEVYKDHDYWPLECIASKAKAHLLGRWHRPERQAKAIDSTEGPSARIAVSGDRQEHFRPGQTEASFD